MTAEAVTIVGVGVGLLAVLVTVVMAQGASLRRTIEAQGVALRNAIEAQGVATDKAIEAQGASLSREIDALRADVGELRRDVHGVSDRVARIEGAMSGPWRPPTNGTPAPNASPEATPSRGPGEGRP